MEKDWLEMRDRVASIHPALERRLSRLDGFLDTACDKARHCDANGINFAIDASKLSVALLKDVEHLKQAEIIDEATCSGFGKAFDRYCEERFKEVFLAFAGCVDHKTEAEVLSQMLGRVSELDPKYQALLVKFAQHVRKTEREGGC